MKEQPVIVLDDLLRPTDLKGNVIEDVLGMSEFARGILNQHPDLVSLLKSYQVLSEQGNPVSILKRVVESRAVSGLVYADGMLDRPLSMIDVTAVVHIFYLMGLLTPPVALSLYELYDEELKALTSEAIKGHLTIDQFNFIVQYRGVVPENDPLIASLRGSFE